jgi:hypothetical protein
MRTYNWVKNYKTLTQSIWWIVRTRVISHTWTCLSYIILALIWLWWIVLTLFNLRSVSCTLRTLIHVHYKMHLWISTTCSQDLAAITTNPLPPSWGCKSWKYCKPGGDNGSHVQIKTLQIHSLHKLVIKGTSNLLHSLRSCHSPRWHWLAPCVESGESPQSVHCVPIIYF